MRVNKAVMPVAGLGTRLLPMTKASPKEMLPIVDKPLIQYAVEEAARAGITEIIFVTSTSKYLIEQHFHPDSALEAFLREHGKTDLLNSLQAIVPKDLTLSYVFQDEALGLGNAILCAKAAVGDEPFVVILADVLLQDSDSICLTSMCEHFRTFRKSVIAVQPVPWSDVHKYGIVSTKKALQIETIIEKPPAEQAPSNLAVLGRYLLTPAIFDALEQVTKDVQGEIQLTNGIANLMQQEEVYAHEFNGTLFDCGSKLGYLQAIVEFSLQHPEIGTDFKAYLHSRHDQIS